MKLLISILLLAFSGSAIAKTGTTLLLCEFDTGGVFNIQIHEEYLNPFLGIPKVTLDIKSESFQGYAYVSDESYTVAIPKNFKTSIKDVSHTISFDRENDSFNFIEYETDLRQPKRRKGICKYSSNE